MKSELFIECAKNVVDFYNATQEAIGSKNRMEYPVVKEEKKPREWAMNYYPADDEGYVYKNDDIADRYKGDNSIRLRVSEVIE